MAFSTSPARKSSDKIIICYIVNAGWYFKLHWLDRALAAMQSGYRVHLIAHIDDATKKILQRSGIICHESHLIPASLNPLNFIKSSITIFTHLRKLKPTVIHCITIKACLIGGFYAKHFKLHLIMSIVGLGRVFESKKIAYSLIRKMVIPLWRVIVSRHDTLLIFEHSDDKIKLEKLLWPATFNAEIILGAGIDTNLFSYIPEPATDEITVLHAGRLIHSKGLPDLIAIKHRLMQQQIHFNLMVAGIQVADDADRLPLTALEAWAARGDIVWLGERDNMQELIKNSHIVALPSTYAEGIPRILVEAAACGRPCICYDSGGCKEIVAQGINGFIIEKNNLTDFADKLSHLIQDAKLRHSMGSKGRARVKHTFAADKIVNETLAVYQRIIGSGN